MEKAITNLHIIYIKPTSQEVILRCGFTLIHLLHAGNIQFILSSEFHCKTNIKL